MRGRPSKNLCCRIIFRVTPEELQRLNQVVNESGITVSEAFRIVAQKITPEFFVEDKDENLRTNV